MQSLNAFLNLNTSNNLNHGELQKRQSQHPMKSVLLNSVVYYRLVFIVTISTANQIRLEKHVGLYRISLGPE